MSKYTPEFSQLVINKYTIELKSILEIAKETKSEPRRLSKILKDNKVKIRAGNRINTTKDFTNHRFGKLFVIEVKQSNGGKHGRIAVCKCDCGEIVELGLGRLTSKSRISCGCQLYKEKNFKLKGYYQNIISSAKKRNIELLVSEDELFDLLVKQNFQCKFTGQKIALPQKYDERGTASVDRIDSNKPYTLDNVQWLHKDVNLMKMDFDESEFVNWCDLISKNYNKKLPTNIESFDWI